MTGRSSISLAELLDSNTLARGLAILAVVGCHIPYAHAFWKPLWVFASAGKLAVSVFLFSSGLLLQHQANRAEGKLKISTWLRKRFMRIYPLYWAGLAFTLLCAQIFRHRIYDGLAILANVAGIPLLLGQRVVSCGYTAPFWFISVLLLCYVLFLCTRRIRRKAFLVAGALLMAFAGLQVPGVMTAAVLAFPSFFMGMAVADRLQRPAAAIDARLHAALFLPLLGMLVVVFKGPNFFNLADRWSAWLDMVGCVGLTLIPWPALVLVAFLQKSLAAAAPRLLRAALWISGLAFAIFCIHEPLLLVLDKCTVRGHPWTGLLGYMLLTGVLAWGLDALDRRWRGTPPTKG